jgi:ABC-type phosphate/phosphonate transport system substrate-binding protein
MCILAFAAQAAAGEIVLVIDSPTEVIKTLSQWDEFGRLISAETGQKVKIIPILIKDFDKEVESQRFDFYIGHSAHAIFLQKKLNAVHLATLNESGSGTRYGGVIIAKKGSSISKGADLKGKKVICLSKKSAAASYMFQAYHLYLQGIDAEKDFAVLKEGERLEDMVLAVRAGLSDAAFIRTKLLESMAKDGTIRIDEFTIVDQRTDPDFPYLHTTALYPQWILSASSKTDPALAAKVKEIALKLPPDSKAAQSAKIKGFVEPLPLDELDKAMQAVKFPPYDK